MADPQLATYVEHRQTKWKEAVIIEWTSELQHNLGFEITPFSDYARDAHGLCVLLRREDPDKPAGLYIVPEGCEIPRRSIDPKELIEFIVAKVVEYRTNEHGEENDNELRPTVLGMEEEPCK